MATDDPARATVDGVPPPVPEGDADARDHAARVAATTDLDATLLLEAGAGTGKTTVLVERYLECLRRGKPAAKVVAITFTEKAAGELRLRVRQTLGEEAAADGVSQETAERLGAALAAIDEAPISTIHSFAARLLRERPVEAGIDPAFSQLDAIESDLLTARLWSDFVTAALGGDGQAGAGSEAMADVLGAGVSLEALREVVLGGKGLFQQRYDLQFDPASPARPDVHSRLEELESSARQLLRHCEDFCCDDTDNGLKLAVRAAQQTLAVCAEPAGDLHGLAAQVAALPLWKQDPGGRQPSWGGKEGKQAFGDTYRELRTSWVEARELYESFVAAQGLAVAREFIVFADREQLRLGVLDFADLLGRLRNLLRDRPDVRRDFQEAFDFLLVDEFQDTDPLQAEIVFLLAEDGEGRERRGAGVGLEGRAAQAGQAVHRRRPQAVHLPLPSCRHHPLSGCTDPPAEELRRRRRPVHHAQLPHREPHRGLGQSGLRRGDRARCVRGPAASLRAASRRPRTAHIGATRHRALWA